MKKETTNLQNFKKELEEDIKNFDDYNKKALQHKNSNSKSEPNQEIRSRQELPLNLNTNSSHLSKADKKNALTDSLKHKSKINKALKVLLTVLVFLGIITIGFYCFLQWELGRIQHNENEPIDDSAISKAVDLDDKYGLGHAGATAISDPSIMNILLIGQDRREGQKSEMRSDAMIIASINSQTKKIIQISLMRDMYLPIPGYGYGPLNTTYMVGGFKLLNETIEKNFGIHIDGNMEVDFYRFINLMDILGPIEIELSKEEAEYLNNNSSNNWSNMSGINEHGWVLTEGKNMII